MYLNIYALIHVIAIAFQLAGALLLLIFNVSTKREEIIKTFASRKGIIEVEGTEIRYKSDDFKRIYKIAWLNKISFLYIAIGYLVDIYGRVEEDIILLSIILGVIFFTIILIFVGIGVAIILTKNRNKEYFVITKEDIENYSLDTVEFVTAEDIDEMLKELS